jgi:hypothetical protein
MQGLCAVNATINIGKVSFYIENKTTLYPSIDNLEFARLSDGGLRERFKIINETEEPFNPADVVVLSDDEGTSGWAAGGFGTGTFKFNISEETNQTYVCKGTKALRFAQATAGAGWYSTIRVTKTFTSVDLTLHDLLAFYLVGSNSTKGGVIYIGKDVSNLFRVGDITDNFSGKKRYVIAKRTLSVFNGAPDWNDIRMIFIDFGNLEEAKPINMCIDRVVAMKAPWALVENGISDACKEGSFVSNNATDVSSFKVGFHNGTQWYGDRICWNAKTQTNWNGHQTGIFYLNGSTGSFWMGTSSPWKGFQPYGMGKYKETLVMADFYQNIDSYGVIGYPVNVKPQKVGGSMIKRFCMAAQMPFTDFEASNFNKMYVELKVYPQ